MMIYEYIIDYCFDEIYLCIFFEFLWDSIVFEGCVFIDMFLVEIKCFGFINIFIFLFLYIDVLILYYVNKVGFYNVDY